KRQRATGIARPRNELPKAKPGRPPLFPCRLAKRRRRRPHSLGITPPRSQLVQIPTDIEPEAVHFVHVRVLLDTESLIDPGAGSYTSTMQTGARHVAAFEHR